MHFQLSDWTRRPRRPVTGGFSGPPSFLQGSTVRNKTAVGGETDWDIYGLLNLLLGLVSSQSQFLPLSNIRILEISLLFTDVLPQPAVCYIRHSESFFIALEFSLPREPSCTLGSCIPGGMVCPAWLALLITVCHLCVEISTVYLVNSAMHAVAKQKINLSAEISLIYWEHNDGLQNYSFRFPSSCFDVWPLAAFQPLTLRRIRFRAAQTSFPLLMKALQIWDRAGSGVFSQ